MIAIDPLVFDVHVFYHVCLVGCLEHVLFFHILGIIIPFDFHIFQGGRFTTNQLCSFSIIFIIFQSTCSFSLVTC